MKDKVFRSTRNISDRLAFDLLLEFARSWRGKRAGPSQLGLEDRLANQLWSQFPGNGFYFWEFGHSFN